MSTRMVRSTDLVAPLLRAMDDQGASAPGPELGRLVERLAEGVTDLELPERDACQRSMRAALRNAMQDGRRWQASVLLSGYLLSLARDPRSWLQVSHLSSGIPTPGFVESIDRSVDDFTFEGSPVVDLWRGVREFVDGDDARAMSLFNAAGSHEEFPHLFKDSMRGASTCRDLPSQTALLEVDGGPAVESIDWLVEPAAGSGPGPVIVLTGDDVYWRAFGLSIIESIRKAGATQPARVHFHVVNPAEASTAGALAALQRVARAADVRMSVTAEHAPGAERSYYASARYLQAPSLLAALDRDVVMLDMDIELTLPPARFLAQFPRERITQLASTGPYWGFVPWRRYWAGLLYLPNDEAGALFAKLLSAACRYLWGEREPLRWWTDQTALYVAHRAMRSGGMDGRVNLISRTPSGLRSSEKLKIDGLRQLDEIRAAMDRGENWHAALEEAQR